MRECRRSLLLDLGYLLDYNRLRTGREAMISKTQVKNSVRKTWQLLSGKTGQY